MVRPWKAILAAFVIFLAGAASGALAVRLYSNTAQKPQASAAAGRPSTPWIAQRMDFIRRMGPRLELTQEQQGKIDSILHESQQRMRKLWEPLAPQAEAEMAEVRKRIDAVLTPAQHEKFEKLLKEKPARIPSDMPGRRRREAQGQSAASQDGPPQGPAPEGPRRPPHTNGTPSRPDAPRP